MSTRRSTDCSALLSVELSARELQVARSFLEKLASSEARLAERAHELHTSSGDDAHAAFARQTDEQARLLKRLHLALPA